MSGNCHRINVKLARMAGFVIRGGIFAMHVRLNDNDT
ncbi:hypothetical protein GALLN_00800 [Gallionellaceae bacterium]|nr:hypothetical protein GALLN_00800 [Gallionellaceae bacterium]